MKNLKHLGKTLSKTEQQSINGGKLWAGSCSQDWECGINGECINNECYSTGPN